MPAPLAAGPSLPDLSPEAAIEAFLHSLRRPTTLLVAISGGSDSTGLLLALQRAIKTQRFPHRHSLTAATVDHDLRPDSAEEAQQVAALCARLGIPHRIECWTDEKPRHGLSAAARQARYHLLASAADNLGADVIVTGHTLDDQIETVAMRADRSSEGALGLAGMAPATLYAGRLWILRPFLRTRRAAIRTYLTDLGQPWFDDPSNEDPRYERVRIRQAAPAVDPDVIRQAADHRASLSCAAATWLEAAATCIPGPVVKIDLDNAPPPEREKRDHALTSLVAILGGRSHRPATESLARIASALNSGGDFRLTLSGSLALRRGNHLFLLRERRGFLPLSVPAFASATWDGRFVIENRSAKEVTITAGPAAEIDEHLPGAVRSALSANAPQVIADEAFSGSSADTVAITPRLSLFAEFMPGFDQPLADAIGRLIGAEPTPSVPI